MEKEKKDLSEKQNSTSTEKQKISIKENIIKTRLFRYLSIVLIIVIALAILIVLFPNVAVVVLNIFFVLALGLIIIFFSLGILVLVGMREEVSKILDVFLESSLTIVDVMELLKSFYRQFVTTFKAFLIYIAPVIAFSLAFVIYLALLVLYKYVGKTTDVTFITIFLTVTGIASISILNLPGKGRKPKNTWIVEFTAKFKRSFVDGAEVMLVLFFLTMDSTNLFFLPDSLNIPLNAQVGDVDLMKRSIDLHRENVQVTVSIIGIAVFIELIRNIMRIIAVAKDYFKKNVVHLKDYPVEEGSKLRAIFMKKAVRKGFAESKDELIKFFAFMTVLIFAFLFFPRLKMVSLVFASLTALLLDIIFPSRLKQLKGHDLLSRLVIKVFKL